MRGEIQCLLDLGPNLTGDECGHFHRKAGAVLSRYIGTKLATGGLSSTLRCIPTGM